MKSSRIFQGYILVGFGIYFLLQQLGITVFESFFTWPTLLIIIGLAFLAQGYMGLDFEAILPGVIITGFGLHFHLSDHFKYWPDNHIGTIVLIISIGFFLRFLKTKVGLFQAFLFLIFAFILLFYKKAKEYFGILQDGMDFVWFWPGLLIFIGIYFLLRNK